jgi:hypothetical protein
MSVSVPQHQRVSMKSELQLILNRVGYMSRKDLSDLMDQFEKKQSSRLDATMRITKWGLRGDSPFVVQQCPINAPPRSKTPGLKLMRD